MRAKQHKVGKKIALHSGIKIQPMKKLMLAALLMGFVYSCNNKEEQTNSTTTESAPVTPGIDNVNGNIPDTSDAIRLNQPLPKDSSGMKDSVRH